MDHRLPYDDEVPGAAILGVVVALLLELAAVAVCAGLLAVVWWFIR